MLGPGLTPYEAQQVALIHARAERTSLHRRPRLPAGQAGDRAGGPQGSTQGHAGQDGTYVGPAGALVRRAIPTGAIEGAINTSAWLAER